MQGCVPESLAHIEVWAGGFSLQIRESRRPDSNRGPLHYEGKTSEGRASTRGHARVPFPRRSRDFHGSSCGSVCPPVPGLTYPFCTRPPREELPYAYGVRGTAEQRLLDTPLPEMLREVTGLEPERSGSHVLLDEGAGVRSTQRLALGDVGGDVVAFTWPAELVPQARYAYDGERAPRLIAAARDGRWEVDMRPHLAFRNSRAAQRFYTNPTIGVDEYVARWTGPDGLRIGQHEAGVIRTGLWPWLLERGYASHDDEPELEPFLSRLGRRPAHLRPGLRLLRRWRRDEIAALPGRDALAQEICSAVNCLLTAVGDPRLPAR